MKVALDTNVLAYAEGLDDERRLTVARSLIAKAEPEAWVISVQVLGELFNVLAAAADAGCGMLLSEDMQHGFIWNGVTVINPFQDPPDPLLQPLLGISPSV